MQTHCSISWDPFSFNPWRYSPLPPSSLWHTLTHRAVDIDLSLRFMREESAITGSVLFKGVQGRLKMNKRQKGCKSSYLTIWNQHFHSFLPPFSPADTLIPISQKGRKWVSARNWATEDPTYPPVKTIWTKRTNINKQNTNVVSIFNSHYAVMGVSH